VPVHAGLSVQARKLCHARIAALPAEALRLYRARVDAQARQWLEQGEAERDPRLLRKVVEEAFASRSGDRALDLLGDLAFERGDFVGAERWWRMIVGPVSAAPAAARDADSLALVYPDPQGAVARVRAKQILAHIFRGDAAGAAELLAAFRAAHGKAEGPFAGRKGRYADVLQDLAKSPPAAGKPSWLTFAGDPSRSFVAAEAQVGPFAHLRGDVRLLEGARVGNFVEVKKSVIGERAKAMHLTYLGDARVGSETNVGAGTITCNYDGVHKNATVIGRRVFVGSDTALVAPVKVGDGAYIAAGSTITDNIPPDALAIARGRQVNKPGWAAARRREMAALKKGKLVAKKPRARRSRSRSARVSRGKVAVAAKRARKPSRRR